MAVKKADIAKMLKNLDLYGQACLTIRDKNAEMKPFQLNDAQRIIHKKLHEQYKKEGRVKAIILKARQEGVSTYTAARFFRRLHLMPNQEALVIAHEKDASQTIFGIYDRYASHLPDEVKPMVRYSTKQSSLLFDNPDDKTRGQVKGLNSLINIETANDSNAGRGKTLQMIHASEMAFWEKPEAAWISMNQAATDKGSEVIIESTANGIGNFFHNQWKMAVAGNSDFIAIFLPWWIDPMYARPVDKHDIEEIRDTLTDDEKTWMEEGFEYEGDTHKLTFEQIAWRRDTIRNKLGGKEDYFRQEYPATATEAFLVSGNSFFDEDVLLKYHYQCKPVRERLNLVKMGQALIPKHARYGFVRVWLRPGEKLNKDDREPVYVIGADTASGRMVAAQEYSMDDPERERGGSDFSSADVVDIANRRQVAQIHARLAPELFAQQLFCLGYWYSQVDVHGFGTPALIAVENNHDSGGTVLVKLQQELRYPRLYKSKRYNRRTNRPTEVLGWRTTVETRPVMLDRLSEAVRNESLTIPCEESIAEMMSFVRGDDGKPQAQEGAHDDRVISLAIALEVGQTTNLTLPRNFNKTELVSVGSSPTGWFD